MVADVVRFIPTRVGQTVDDPFDKTVVVRFIPTRVGHTVWLATMSGQMPGSSPRVWGRRIPAITA